jgi:hypothetical protein
MDRDSLVQMGFEPALVDQALAKHADPTRAMDWMLSQQDNQETLQQELSAQQQEQATLKQEDLVAQSLVCDDCQVLLKSHAAAELHAHKTGHASFSESTQEIKPLTAEEKQLKIMQLQEKLKQKRQERQLNEIEESKQKEKVRRATGQEMAAIKEKLEQDALKKSIAERKAAKLEEKQALERVRAQLQADKLAKKQKVFYS